MKKILLNLIIISCVISSCAIVNPGEVGVKQQFGKLKGEVQNQGLVILNPLQMRRELFNGTIIWGTIDIASHVAICERDCL